MEKTNSEVRTTATAANGQKPKTEKSAEQKTKAEKPAEQKTGKGKKWIGILSAALAAGLLLLAYCGMASYYKQHFYPRTVINGVECGGMTKEEAAGHIEEVCARSYQLSLVGKNQQELLVLSASDIRMTITADASIERLLEGQQAWAWPAELLGKNVHSGQVSVAADMDTDAIEAFLDTSGLFEKTEGDLPRDAYISEYQEDKHCYEIIPEEEGDLLNREVTIQKVSEALAAMENRLDLEAEMCYEQPQITAADSALQERLALLNRLVGSCITYDWNGEQVIVDGELIHQWLLIDADGVTLDEEQIEDFVATNAKAYDTYGKKRKFKTFLGEELTLPSGAYGWKTDRKAETEALIALIMDGAVTDREPEYSCTAWVRGKNDIGSSYVEADLTNQHLYLYLNGELVLETDFVSGDVSEGNATPAGVFGITYKTRDAVLRGRTYETPVQYWMPFNGNVGMHDASWRRTFGGDIYLTNGSHGCINLPVNKAAEIYDYVSKGFPVICYYY